MKTIWIINGPNLNMLGIREKEIYGRKSLKDLEKQLLKDNPKVQLEFFQSNHEGQIIDWLQEAYFKKVDGIVINPAGYTHSSIALADAIKAISPLPVIEVHLSKVDEREEFRKISYIKPYCLKQIQGEGFQSYQLAIDDLLKYIE
ncbi:MULTISPECIES: type II 3-dehydroquinate dehydratase [Terrabacteria group]|uniref:type II 3-dehydroquinate dehydratase n=1 Tax=Bacillati TaxID=1783272 RepID=UPI001939ABBD|nr:MULTISPECIES: type II 3-dehydroquinate dehydratase [Terrabacteria group]MBW9212172.1 type II 3-dehydroquinate dehydratase [Trueperella sp. zg.1013]QRG86283.1 type II 3-dehydroquinate dehydratase [Bulleidia sp. zg-1006]